jgi:hypothetical protein
MRTRRLLHQARRVVLCVGVTAVAALTPAVRADQATAPSASVARGADPALVQSILELDCAHLAGPEARSVLARAPAPRIMLFQGSFAPVTMQPFAEFLVAMGYPESRLRNPADGALSYSSFGDSLELAGTLAWHYENEGLMPMLIGHSQGGMMVVRILHELHGAFHDAIPVRDPTTGTVLSRTTITDPLTRAVRPVLGLQVDYAAALATGKWPRIVLGQWDMLSKVHRIPDTVVEFSAFSIPWDPIAGTFAHPEPYEALGTASVRNVILPAGTSHIGIPLARALAADALTHAWIDAYEPDAGSPFPDAAGVDTTNLLHAADLWFSVRKHWCRSAQQRLRSRGGE